LAKERVGPELRTFSVAFKDPRYDERGHQARVARALGTSHHVVEAGPAEIASALPEVIWHAETPLVRTAPAPLFLLAREVRSQGLTVVVTGEGADELFWGYDLFKEVALRALHRREPERAVELLDRLYPYLGPGGGRRGPAWRRFLLGVELDGDPLSSHLTRARATSKVKAFYRPEVLDQVAEDASLRQLRAELPAGFRAWSGLERAAWLELSTLLEPNLLSAQGDRMAMAHGVEGRFPFLDHRVFSHSTRLPASRKLSGLRDKVALRELAGAMLPPEIASRPKLPYRAPEVAPFFEPGAPRWVDEVLSPAALESTGLWDPKRVTGLLRRCRAGRAAGVREGMALVGILSTQLWHSTFIGAGLDRYPAETTEPRVLVDRTSRRFEEVA
jgi:asparagine synthase (glutamine-hydrolysing)